jgi:hypothetical protein
MSGGGGGGSSKTTTTSTQQLPAWEQEPAKAYLSSLMGYVFPGTQVPANWFSTGGFGFPSGGVTGAPSAATMAAQGGPTATQGGGPVMNAQNSAALQMLQQIDPTGTAYAMFAPMISGSPFLQQMALTNPAAIVGAVSPAAASQLAGLYGGGGGGGFPVPST